MSIAAESIRNLLNAIEISQQNLFEESDYDILKNAVGGKELFKYIRQSGLSTHVGDFKEAGYGPNGHPNLHKFSIAVGDKGCAFIIDVSVTYYHNKCYIWTENDTAPQVIDNFAIFRLIDLLGPNVKFFTTGMFQGANAFTDTHLKSRSIRRVQAFSKNLHFKENFEYILYQQLLPFAESIFTKSLNDVSDVLIDSFKKGDYETAEWLSRRSKLIKDRLIKSETHGLLRYLSRSNDVLFRDPATDAIRQTFTEMTGIELDSKPYPTEYAEWAKSAVQSKQILARIVKNLKKIFNVRV